MAPGLTGANSSNARLLVRKEAACVRGVSVLAPVFADRALNAEVWDADGRRYIDFAGGIGVLNVGHRHPRVMAAVSAQMERFTHTCFQVLPYGGYVELAERLNAAVPGAFPKRTALFSTGAEAIENAVKIARAATGRPGIVAFSGAFHGRTALTMAMTGKVKPYKRQFGVSPPGIFHAPFPAAQLGVSEDEALRGLERLFAADVDPSGVAAVIIEPVQGEGGFYLAPESFLRRLREICDRHGILFAADEVQSGFGRTGRLFAMEHYSEIVPDLTVCAKSLAAGFPLSAVTGRAEIMDAADPGGLGGTYAGNPVAIAAALAVLDLMAEDALPARGGRLGATLMRKLEALAAEMPEIAEVRGLGGMVAVEFRDPTTARALPDLTKQVQAEALEHGLVLLSCGVEANALRFLFPLTIEDDVFDEALTILEACIRSALT